MAPFIRSRRLTAWLALLAVLLAPVVVWSASVGDPRDYLRYQLPPGQALYIFSKLFGLLALSALWIQCLQGLASRSPVLTGFPVPSRSSHRWLGLTVVGTALLHYGLFFVAASLRAGHPAWKLLLPDFSHGYLNFYQGLGWVALSLLVLGAFAGWQSARGRLVWRKVHFVWSAVFLLVFLHAFAIGSESRYGAMRYVVLFMAVSLVAAAGSRLRAAMASVPLVVPRPDPTEPNRMR